MIYEDVVKDMHESESKANKCDCVRHCLRESIDIILVFMNENPNNANKGANSNNNPTRSETEVSIT